MGVDGIGWDNTAGKSVDRKAWKSLRMAHSAAIYGVSAGKGVF